MADHIIFAATFAGIFFIAGSGLLVLTGLGRYVSVAQGAYVVLGAGLTNVFTRSAHPRSETLAGMGLSFFQALIIAAIITGIIAVVLGFVLIHLRGAESIAGSFIISFVVVWLVNQYQLLDGGVFNRDTIKMAVGKYDFADLVMGSHRFSLQTGMMFLVLLFCLVFVIFIQNIKRSKLSIHLRAVGENEKIAKSNCVSPIRVVSAANFIAGLSAGVAGAFFLYALNAFHQKQFSDARAMWSVVFSIGLLVVVSIAKNKRLSISALVLFLIPAIFFYCVHAFNEYVERDFALTHRFTSENVMLALVAVVGLALIHFKARLAKNKL